MRSFTIVDAPQRSPEWYAARAGRLTGSRAGDILARLKSGGEAACRRDYRVQLAAERLTGIPQESGFVNAEMQRGIDCEPFARASYEARTGLFVRETGFLQHSSLMVGCSLDGDVDDFFGIQEFKCPKSATHLTYLRTRTVPTEYMPQIRHNLWVSGAQWCDFVSWDDRFPAHLQLVVIRVHAKDADIDGYAKEAMRFLAEVAVELQELEAAA